MTETQGQNWQINQRKQRINQTLNEIREKGKEGLNAELGVYELASNLGVAEGTASQYLKLLLATKQITLTEGQYYLNTNSRE